MISPKSHEKNKVIEIVITPNSSGQRGIGKVGKARTFRKHCCKVWRSKGNVLHLIPLDDPMHVSYYVAKIMTIISSRQNFYDMTYEIIDKSGTEPKVIRSG